MNNINVYTTTQLQNIFTLKIQQKGTNYPQDNYLSPTIWRNLKNANRIEKETFLIT